MLLRSLSVLLLIPGFAAAGDLQVWNQTEFKFLETDRYTWSVFGAFRLRNSLSDAYDNRAGAQGKVRLHRRVSLTGGYLHHWYDATGLGFREENRVYATPELLLASRPLRILSVTPIERSMSLRPGPAYNRYRPRVEIERFRKIVSPFLSQEFLFQREGFLRSRSAAGLRYRFESGVAFEAGYLFDSIKTGPHWLPRHAIRTGLSFGLPHR